jgi:hypothetical protein
LIAFLSAHSDIKIVKSEILFKGSKYGYDIDLQKSNDKKYTIFHITITSKKLTNNFQDFNQTFRKII